VAKKGKERLDSLRPLLGAVFLASYAATAFVPSSPWTTPVFLGAGTLLYAISVPYASAFHKALALAAFLALGIRRSRAVSTRGHSLGGFLLTST
jgi:hypothetical protein